MIHVLAIITAKPGMREQIWRHSAPTCRPSMPNRAASNTVPPWMRRVRVRSRRSWARIRFVVVEKWDSLDALKAHGAAQHMAAYGAKVRDMISSRVIHVLSPAG